jgi:hypothetical protein
VALSLNKKFLIGCGCLALIVVVAFASVIGYLMYSESDPDYQRELAAKKAEGLEFGKTTDQNGCIQEGLTRARRMTAFEITPGVANEAFVQTCLRSSRPTTDFCNGVPGYWSLKTSEWGDDQCEKARMNPFQTGCKSVFSAQVSHCSGREP